MRRLFRAFELDRGQPVDQILDQDLVKKVKESDKILRPQLEVAPTAKQEWLIIKQEFLIRSMLHEEIQFVRDWLRLQKTDS